MAVVKCDKCGQHYDNRKYRICPNCGRMDLHGDRTVSLDNTESATAGNMYEETVSLESSMGEVIAEDITIGEHSAPSGIQPVVGWLVCTEGAAKGRDYRLQHGWNRIGRSADMQICITDDKTMSRCHGAVVYDERSCRYFAVNETGCLMYLNGRNVADAQLLQNGDTLEIGNSKFVFIPYCTEERKW